MQDAQLQPKGVGCRQQVFRFGFRHGGIGRIDKQSGPRLWARTGCRYDIASGRAQCETGGCGGKYDCSAAKLGASVGTTVSEWTFYEPISNGNISYFKDSPDISAVDGADLNIDIQPVGGSPHNPFDALGGHDIQWLAENYPLTKHGVPAANCSDTDPNCYRWKAFCLNAPAGTYTKKCSTDAGELTNTGVLQIWGDRSWTRKRFLSWPG